MVVHENFRFMPWYRFIKTALDDDVNGGLLQATFRLRPGDGQGPKAYLDRQPYFQTMRRFEVQETAVHWVDLFRFLPGPPVSVYADLRRLNPAIAGEDAGIILFERQGGCERSLTATGCWITPAIICAAQWAKPCSRGLKALWSFSATVA